MSTIKVGQVWRKLEEHWGYEGGDLVVITKVFMGRVAYRFCTNFLVHGDAEWPEDTITRRMELVEDIVET